MIKYKFSTQKPTHTGQYLHYTSNHSKSTKQAIYTSLQNPAIAICTNEDDLRNEYQQIASKFVANGSLQNILTKKHRKTDNHTVQDKSIGAAIIPYAPVISEKLRRKAVHTASDQLSDHILHYEAYSQRLGRQTKHNNQRTASQHSM